MVANNNQVVNTLGDDVFIFVLNPIFYPAVRHYYLIKTCEIQLFFNFLENNTGNSNFTELFG